MTENSENAEKNSESQENKPIFSLDFGKLVLPASIVLAAVLISGTLVFTSYRNNPSAQLGAVGNNLGNTQKVKVSADDDPALGEKNAPVTMIEFSDFQCPFCRSFWKDALPQIKTNYIDTGKVKLVYRDYPLPSHPSSHIAAEAAECANEQGKFWEMHDKIFSEQAKQGQGTVQFTKINLLNWAGQVGLNANQFSQCFDSGKYKAEIDKDLADGSAAGVSGTPSFFINGRLIVGAQPFASFQDLIEQELKK